MENIKRITSFEIDHRVLVPGFYISRRDGNITTYDLRTRVPNSGDYMDNVTMHTFEHMFATYVRNSEIGDRVIYFGPMGCQTGFYLLTDGVDDRKVFEVTKKVLTLIAEHDGPVFGASEKECGNYRTLELSAAKRESIEYLEVLEKNTCINYGG